MRKLNSPIDVISAAGMIVVDITETKRALKEIVSTYSAPLSNRTLRVVDSLVIVEPGGGGGSIGMSYDKVTIIPDRISVEASTPGTDTQR